MKTKKKYVKLDNVVGSPSGVQTLDPTGASQDRAFATIKKKKKKNANN